MGDVLWNLEFALQLQDTFEGGGSSRGRALQVGCSSSSGGGGGGRAEVIEPSNSMGSTASVDTTMETSSTSRPHETRVIVEETDDEVANSAAFSQLVRPTGRQLSMCAVKDCDFGPIDT
ncbi:hypothetical protein EJB05_32116, partial [Eragrostis curvula]